jgi:hypothetical protein
MTKSEVAQLGEAENPLLTPWKAGRFDLAHRFGRSVLPVTSPHYSPLTVQGDVHVHPNPGLPYLSSGLEGEKFLIEIAKVVMCSAVPRCVQLEADISHAR